MSIPGRSKTIPSTGQREMLRTGERSIVFDSVVQIELLQVERVLVKVSVEHASDVMARVVAKRGAKVECRTKIFGSIGELDTPSTARKDPWTR